MLIILLDDTCLYVYESPFDAQTDIEPPDAENGIIRAAFDEHAVPYRVEWISTNRHRKILGVLPSISFGNYRLVPAGPADRAGLIALLENRKCTNPPQADAALTDLLQKMRSGCTTVS